ncbi:MAG: hypothetical protein ACYCV7_03790, partial [Acidimicrobiales bacterium]
MSGTRSRRLVLLIGSVALVGGLLAPASSAFAADGSALSVSTPSSGLDPAPDSVQSWGVPSLSTASAPSIHRLVGMASTPDGGGYWLVAADGGVF